MNFKQVTNITIPEGSVVKITDPNGLILWQKSTVFNGLCFTALVDGSYGMSHYGTNKTTTIPKLQYSRDGVNWTDWFFESISVKAGDKVYFKGDNPDGIGRSTSDYSRFTSTGLFEASGNVMSILGADEIKAYSFYSLFFSNKMITTAPTLPATTLATRCYSNMFQDCASLTTAPTLPATTLQNGCYYQMFDGCSKLTTAPELPATTLASYCYGNMFRNCTSLTIAPTLPATTLAISCYEYMFQSCRALTTAPALPATALASFCYSNMFKGCTSLTTAPGLPSTTLAGSCYSQMFYGCTSLTTASELPATRLEWDCYYQMFYGCTKLNSVKHSIISWDTTHTSNWLYGVASTGVMRCPTNSTIPSKSASGIPSGWSRINF